MTRFRREPKETPKRVIRAYEATARAWQAEPIQQPDGIARYVTPAEAADAFPLREKMAADIERRAAMVRGLSVQDAARVLHRAGECGDAVLECLGIEVLR